MFILACLALALALLPLLMTVWNLRFYTPPPPRPEPTATTPPGTLVAVCIPARNEEANIEAIVRSLLVSTHAALRIYVYDDLSTDRTPKILAQLAASDPRVILTPTHPLPPGWSGKQHACWRMGTHAVADGCHWLLFTDADVRFSPDAIARTLAARDALTTPDRPVDLLSAFPRQLTATLPEHLLVPMMFYLLLGYLPFARMRATNDPATTAGCGQFLFISARAYTAIDGHAAFKSSMHDGIKMPRAVRRAGLRTDLFDASSLAAVRMYQGLAQTWRGFAKNAYEGLGSPAVLLFFTILHALGHLMPWIILAWTILPGITQPWTLAVAASAAACPILQRLILAERLQHSAIGALLHPLGIALMTAIQWHSYILHLTGRRAWKGRVLDAPDSPEVPSASMP